jgi:two-component system, cell cycle response regulator
MGCIVVAEDSALLRAVACRTLVDHGYVVHDASDGLEALEQIRRHRPDVVLCDLAMPRLDGYGVLEAMKADPAVADTPVVFLTSHTRSDQAAEGLRRGAYDYLRKPFDGVELIARMQAAVRTKRLQDELQRLLSTDPLTGLANRSRAEQALTAAIAGGASGVSVAILDVDHFKRVNDEHGHARGDAVLKDAAYLLRKSLRSFELIYRLGGEEFLIVLPGVPISEGRSIAERVRTGIEEARPGGLPVTVSLGVAAAVGADVAFEPLFRAADEALYEAKRSGKNRTVSAA